MKLRVTVVVLAGTLCVMLTAGEAFGMAWGNGSHRRGSSGSNGSVASGSVGSGSGRTASVPEPSTLYAIGSALALLGGAGWILRRK